MCIRDRDKGMSHVAGNTNTKTIRHLPVVTEVCVQYVKKPTFDVNGVPMSMKEWLRYESVSYTHLDVYKRQFLCCHRLFFRLGPALSAGSPPFHIGPKEKTFIIFSSCILPTILYYRPLSKVSTFFAIVLHCAITARITCC